MSAIERALDAYLIDHPDGCEISFNAGWHAAMHEATRTRVLIATKCPTDRKSTRLNSSHIPLSRMPSSA